MVTIVQATGLAFIQLCSLFIWSLACSVDALRSGNEPDSLEPQSRSGPQSSPTKPFWSEDREWVGVGRYLTDKAA